MTRFHFERPDGPPNNNAQNILVHLNEFVPPQGFISAEAIPEQFLLDLFPNAAAAYSLRQLRTAYTGPAIRVERTSDNTTQDIGFLANGLLDTVSLLDFVDGSDGMVKIIYDQSERGIDLDAQLVTSFFPLIVIGGVLQTSNSSPSIVFDGINDNLFSTNNLFLSTPSQMFIFGVWRKLDLSNDPTNFNLRSGTNPPDRVTGRAPLSNGNIVWNAGNETTRQLVAIGGFNDLLQHVYVFLEDNIANDQIIRRDAVELAQRAATGTTTTVLLVDIGANGPAGVDAANMGWQELVYYDDLGAVVGDVLDIESNIFDFYNNVFLQVNGNLILADDLDNAIEVTP